MSKQKGCGILSRCGVFVAVAQAVRLIVVWYYVRTLCRLLYIHILFIMLTSLSRTIIVNIVVELT